MKNKVTVMLLSVAAVTMIVWQAAERSASALHAAVSLVQERQREDQDLPEREEIHQNYQLAAGARVEVSGINGPVDIETASGSTAEVHVVRSARSREDLAYHKIIIEQTPNSLVVRGERESEREGRSGRGITVRQRVLLRVPRQIDLTAKGVNGRVIVGEVDGPVHVSGINGKVDVAHAATLSDISGINGSVNITVKQLGERGLRVSGINGAVELRFTDDLNADLNVSGINGSVSPELPNVTLQGKISPANFRARIGAGGAPITVSGVNGRVRLVRAA